MTISQIADQIEQDAGYYTPVVYDALTRFQSFETEADPESENYIPLTTAQQGKTRQILFAVGLLPPSNAVSGRALDRSASVGNIQGAVENWGGVVRDGSRPVGPPTLTAQATTGNKGATGSNAGGSPVWQPMNTQQKANAILNAYRARYGQEPSIETLRMLTAQTLHEQPEDGKYGASWPDFNPGGMGFKAKNKGGVARPHSFGSGSSADTYGWYHSYATAADGAAAWMGTVSKNPATLAAAAAGDPQAYAQALKDFKYYTAPVSEYAGGVKHYYNLMQTAIPDIATINAALPPGGSNLVVQEAPATKWASQGAAAAQDAAKQNTQITKTDLITAGLGSKLRSAQDSQVLAVQEAIAAMAAIPPLQMLVNPLSFKYGAEKIVNDGNWGRNGPIIEHWGNQQEKLEASGKLAAFYAMDGADTRVGSPGNSPGLTRMARSFSKSYQNFLSLYLIYKNNGGIWLEDSFSSTPASKKMNLSLVGSVYIYYDNTMYVGSFDNFSMNEAADQPFTLEYSFSFTVRAWFLLDRPPNPQLRQMAQSNSVPVSKVQADTQFGGAIADQGGGPVMPQADVDAWEAKKYEEFQLNKARDTLDSAFADPPTEVRPFPKGAPTKSTQVSPEVARVLKRGKK